MLLPRAGYNSTWWIPQLALDGATISLLSGIADPAKISGKSKRFAWYASAGCIVIVARVVDVSILQMSEYAFVHQSLDMLVLLAWAWKVRVEIKEAVAIAMYGRARLPLPALLAAARSGSHKIDVQLMQLTAQYAIAKPVLLVAVVGLLRTLHPKEKVGEV